MRRQIRGGSAIERVLQRVEIGHAVLRQGDDFAIKLRAIYWQVRQCSRDSG